jgi:hypothetical protein
MTHHLFSEELFSDTSLSPSADRCNFKPPRRLSGVKPPRRLSGVKPPRRMSGGNINQKPLKMQNKPNFQITQINITTFLTRPYRNVSPLRHLRNKPNQTQFKPKTKPFFVPKTPLKPKTNPIPAGHAIALAKTGQTQFQTRCTLAESGIFPCHGL